MMSWTFALCAQAGDIALTGWSAFGLTGMILGWLLLKHLPDKDRQLEKLLADKDAQIRTALNEAREERHADRDLRHVMTVKFQEVMAEERVAHATEREKDYLRFEQRMAARDVEVKATLAEIVKHCEKENQKLTEVFKLEIGQLVGAKGARTHPDAGKHA